MENIMTHYQSIYLNIFIICCVGFSAILEGVKSKEKTSLEQTILKKYVFSNASKQWNHYVRKLLYNILEIYFPNILKYLSITSFVESDKYVPHDGSLLLYLKYSPRYVKQVIVKVNYMRHLVYSNLLRKPLETYRFGEHSLRMRKMKPQQGFRLYYMLHPNFHLKIFAHYIYFSSNSFFKCYFGKIIVKNFIRHTFHL